LTITNPQAVPLIVPTTIGVPPTSIPMEMPWKPRTPLRLAQPLHNIPMDSPNRLTNFIGVSPLNAEEHVHKFYDALTLMNITILDIIISVFVRTFEGEAVISYHFLPNDTIPYWNTMIQEFKKHFQGVDDVASLHRDFATISMRERKFETLINALPPP
jgi:hypothetical protein